MDDEKRKPHNVPKSGRKADKKKSKNDDSQANGDDPRARNPKAFALKSAKKAERKFRHKQEFVEKKHHIPLVDRAPIEPPPIVVAVVGPPGSGKSTLIRCLIKNFTRQTLTRVQGPVTIVSSKQRRITLVECNNDINSMIDMAKIADLALLLVDASYGFEMDTFEFLNICQIHGFPRIMGVLTHLDTIKNISRQRRAKKILKHRFWTEIYQGAKLFYLSTMKRGSYLKHEIRNLGRYISIMKFRPLQWRSTHPYLLVDRIEDLTNEDQIRQNPKMDRKVCLFGYARGAFFKDGQDVHVPGVGDYCLKKISFLEDPCPIPDNERKRKRSLNEKERLLYAPFSGVGGLIYDKDAVYIDLKGSHSHQDELPQSDDPQDTMVRGLLKTGETMDEKMASSSVKLFGESEPGFIDGDDSEEDSEIDDGSGNEEDFDDSENDENDDQEVFSDMEFEEEMNNHRNVRRRGLDVSETLGVEDGAETDDLMFDDEKDDDILWKLDMPSKASKLFQERLSQSNNIQRLVYESNQGLIDDDQFDEFFDDGLIRIRNRKTDPMAMGNTINSLECTKCFSIEGTRDWDESDVLNLIRDCFVTGKWIDETNADNILNSDNDSVCDGDFEDLEAKLNKSSDPMEEQPASATEDLKEKKKRLKETFNSMYDDKDDKKSFYEEWKSETQLQSKLNREEFEDMDQETRVKFEGFKPGMYLRIEIENVPPELMTNFDPKYPLIVGGLLPGESTVGYNNIRLKKHRWYKRVLKSRDPLIISMGWRRFQTVALFYIQDTNGRNRSLKYTPQHLHCMASFWGPISPQSTGLIAFKNISDDDRDSRNFRIAATGVILHTDKSTVIMKKLKLTGSPLKICKKTAFIKGMFNSALEVTKFEGASIRTVSGIRGAVKKAIRAPDGAFRATFEDKILMSDLVFLRSWFTVFVPKFYTIIKNLLLTNEERLKWQGMKTTGQLHAEGGGHAGYKKDSVYKKLEPIKERKTFLFKPFLIPNKLQSELPYKSKPKFLPKSNVRSNRVAVIREPEETEVKRTIQAVKAVARDKKMVERQTMLVKAAKHKKELARIEEKRHQKKRMDQKRVFTKKSNMNRQAAKNR